MKKKKILEEMTDAEKIEAGICPNCDLKMWPQGGSMKCNECGFSLCSAG